MTHTLNFKHYLFIPLLALAACSSSDSSKPTGGLSASLVNNPHTANGLDTAAAGMKPTLEFKDTLHEFGTIHENEVVQYDFNFTNTGKGPLIISSAAGSCGCTVPEYPHDPIPPGKSAVMKVTFNSSGKSGHQEKSVTIHTNTVRGVHMLYIKADIEKSK